MLKGAEEQVFDRQRKGAYFSADSSLPKENEQLDFRLKPDEEAVLDSVFHACDTDGSGLVRVSKIVDYLRNLTMDGESSEIVGFLDDLSLLFDPTGKDVCIDSVAYQEGIYQWIANIKQRSVPNSSPWNNSSDIDKRLNGVVYLGKGEGLQRSHDHILHAASFSGDSMDGVQSWTSDLEESDIIEKVKELQVTNKKLLEENSKLHQQIEATEENNNSLIQEVEKLRKKSMRYENLYEKSKRSEKEFIDLKTTFAEHQSTKERLTSRAAQLEKEVSILQASLDEYQQKVTVANLSAEHLREEKQTLQQELAEQKCVCSKLEELLEVKTQLSNESSSRSEYMSAVISELSFANQMLKTQKNELEIELSETKQELSRINIRQTSDLPVHTSTPFQQSAPTLKEELNVDSDLSLDTSSPGRSNFLRLGNSEEDPFDISSSSQNESGLSDGGHSVSTTASIDKYSSVAQKIARKFKKRKELALKQIEELTGMDNSAEAKDKSEVIARELEDEMELFASKISSLALAKQVAEKRAAKLFILFRRLKAENKCLKDSRGKILRKLGDLSMSNDEVEKRNSELSMSLETTHNKIEELEKLLTDKKEPSTSTRDDFKSEVSSSQQEGNVVQLELEEQICDLKHLVTSLENRQRECDQKVFDLEDQLEEKNALCSKQQQKILELEKSRSGQYPSCTPKEIREILDMLPSVERTGSKDEPVSLVQIKEKLSEYIASIQAKMRSMGIRDSPDGGPEPNDTEFESSCFTVSDSFAPEQKRSPRTQNVHLSPKREFHSQSVQTDPYYSVSIEVQTDLTMGDIKQILNCIEEEKDINDNIQLPVFVEPKITFYELNTEIGSDLGVTPMDNNDAEDKTELMDQIDQETRVAPIGEVKEPEELSPQLSLSEIPKPTVVLNGEELDMADTVPTEEPIKRDRTWSFDFYDKDTSCSEDELAINFRRKRNSADKDASSEKVRSPGAASATSEISASSGSSRRSRRIGISAEPVRLPTWSELRELYKLNQQLELEDELQKEGSLPKEIHPDDKADLTPDNDQEVPYVPDCVQDTIHENSLCASSSSRPELKKQRSVTFNFTEAEEAEKGADSSAMKTLDLEGPELKSCMKTTEVTASEEDDAKQMNETFEGSENTKSDRKTEEATSERQIRKSKAGMREPPPTFLTAFKSVTEVTDIERKFNNAVLNFKTDQYTIHKRLENQERARDVAESGMEKELEKLTSAIKQLEKLSLTYELQEAVGALHKNTDVLRRAGMKVSAQAEQHGCYQKEFLMAPDVEIMISYAEHLRLKIETISEEFDDAKRRVRTQSETDSSSEQPTSPHGTKTERKKSNTGGTDSVKTFRKAFSKDAATEGQAKKPSGNSLYSLAKSLLHNRPLMKKATEGESDGTEETSVPVESSDYATPRTNRGRRQVTYASAIDYIPEEITELPAKSSMVANCTSKICRALMNFCISVALLTLILYIGLNYFEVDFERVSRRLHDQAKILGRRYLYSDSQEKPM